MDSLHKTVKNKFFGQKNSISQIINNILSLDVKIFTFSANSLRHTWNGIVTKSLLLITPQPPLRSAILHLILLYAVLTPVAAEARSAGWLQLRGDRHMSGHAPGHGQMREAPTETWHYDIAVWEGYFSVESRAGSSSLDLPFPDQIDPD